MTWNDAFVPGDALNGIEILYVDDDAQRRDSMREALTSLSPRRVQVAENGCEALKVIMGTQCAVVVCELRMKAMDGIGFLREIRSASNHARAVIPVLLLGEPVGMDVIKAALAAGANSFLIKPFAPAKLYERVLWVLGDSRPFVIRDGRYVIKPVAAIAGDASRSH
jgi:two-component system, chemotaxis family, chemotaxis protein CheY